MPVMERISALKFSMRILQLQRTHYSHKAYKIILTYFGLRLTVFVNWIYACGHLKQQFSIPPDCSLHVMKDQVTLC